MILQKFGCDGYTEVKLKSKRLKITSGKTCRFMLEKRNTFQYGLRYFEMVFYCHHKTKGTDTMKRVFAFFASAVLVCSLLIFPCFATGTDGIPATTRPSETNLEHSETSAQSEEPDESSVQPHDTFPGNGDVV